MYKTLHIQMRNLRQEPIEYRNAGVSYHGGFMVVTIYRDNGIPEIDHLYKMNDVKIVSYGNAI